MVVMRYATSLETWKSIAIARVALVGADEANVLHELLARQYVRNRLNHVHIDRHQRAHQSDQPPPRLRPVLRVQLVVRPVPGDPVRVLSRRQRLLVLRRLNIVATVLLYARLLPGDLPRCSSGETNTGTTSSSTRMVREDRDVCADAAMAAEVYAISGVAAVDPDAIFEAPKVRDSASGYRGSSEDK